MGDLFPVFFMLIPSVFQAESSNLEILSQISNLVLSVTYKTEFFFGKFFVFI